MTATLTATVVQTVTLKPHQKRKLSAALHAYGDIKQQIEALEEALAVHKTEIESIREASGATCIEQDGYKVTLVQPKDRLVIDEKKLLAQGITMTQIENAKDAKPVKAYTKVTLPGTEEN